MADTRRTLTAILALLADNTAGDISPQDMRDAITSASPEYGALYIDTASTTTITGAGTPTKAAGATTSLGGSDGMTVSTSNRITYTEAPTIKALVLMAASSTCSLSTQTLAFSIAKNGTQVAGSIVNRKIGTGSDEGAFALFTVVELAQNDYVEMFVQNNSSGSGTVTLTKGMMAVLSIFV